MFVKTFPFLVKRGMPILFFLNSVLPPSSKLLKFLTLISFKKCKPHEVIEHATLYGRQCGKRWSSFFITFSLNLPFYIKTESLLGSKRSTKNSSSLPNLLKDIWENDDLFVDKNITSPKVPGFKSQGSHTPTFSPIWHFVL